MHVIQVDWLEGGDQEQKRRVVEAFTNALAEIAGTRPENVEIIFRDILRSNWVTGGKLLSDKG